MSIANNKNICPLCHGLTPEYRIGIDQLFKTSSRQEYDAIKIKYDEQIGKETLQMHELHYDVYTDGTIVVKCYAHCHNCNAKWENEMVITPLLGDK